MKFAELKIDGWFRIGDERMIFAKRDDHQFRIVGGPYEHFEADPDMEVREVTPSKLALEESERVRIDRSEVAQRRARPKKEKVA